MYHGSMQSGGQGIYLANITRELSRLGHEVHVIGAPPYAELDPAVRHHRLWTHSFQAMLLDRNGFFGRGAPASHFDPLNFYELASTRFTLSSVINVFSVRALAKLNQVESREGQFDVVHDNQSLGYGLLLMRVPLGRPVVANVHHPLDIDARNSIRHVTTVPARMRRIAWYPWRVQRTVARRLDALITGSQASAALVSDEWQIDRGSIRAIYDGVDTQRFCPGAANESEAGALLFVGNSEDYNKGIVYLLRALEQVKARAHLYLVGGPGELRVAPREMERLGISDRVTIVGRVSDAELAQWYRRAQVLVSPSLFEGFGLPAAEAMACGTAVIATDGGALPEVVADGETGTIVPAADAGALASAIEALLADPARCRDLGAAGRARVLERFTWERTARETAALYDEVLTARGRAS